MDIVFFQMCDIIKRKGIMYFKMKTERNPVVSFSTILMEYDLVGEIK